MIANRLRLPPPEQRCSRRRRLSPAATDKMKSSKRHERVSQLHRLLTLPHQPPLPLSRICEELECSESTGKRLIQDLRDRYRHPVVYDKNYGGYRYELGNQDDVSIELPGLWFTEPELFALLTVRKLINDIEPGLFEKEVAPLGRRVEELLAEAGADAREVDHRIRITSIGRRQVSDRVFRCCADAVLQRTRIRFTYRTRSRPGDAEAARYVSPQRLVYYRNNWYLDAWDHVEFADADTSARRLRSAGFVEVQTELVSAPTPLADAASFREFVGSVVLRLHLERVPDPLLRHRLLERLAQEAERDDPPYCLDYWRLNLRARRPRTASLE